MNKGDAIKQGSRNLRDEGDFNYEGLDYLEGEFVDDSEDLIIDATVRIFTALIGKMERRMDIDDIRQMLYSIKSQVNDVFRSPGRPLRPAVPIEDSVHDDYIICLEDGKRLKVLKRYLQNRYHMSPEVYKKRWGLPDGYPMVAPNYSDVRKKLAIKTGLGYSKAKERRVR